ncbi:MAG TPA: type II secretion system protein [Terriglobia bacterium]|nr:type II secretion system protein [Terriglobia bacterium]
MRRLICCKDSAFSMIEMMLVILVVGTIAAMAIPQAYQAVKAYRLHADASGLAGQLNIARMRAASQFEPYRMVINISAGTYWREQLCGTTSSSIDAACTSPYQPHTAPVIEGGTQYTSQGDSYASCRPVSASGSYPGTILADPSPCPDPLYIHFNTRGAPVDGSGNPLGNGGVAIYFRNRQDLVDAVTVTIGGAVTTWNWDTASSSWRRR